MNAFLTALVGLGFQRFYVFQPMAGHYRLKKVVKCPETDQAAEILLNTYPSAMSGTKKKPSIRNCSLWPSRRGCTQICLTQVSDRSGCYATKKMIS